MDTIWTPWRYEYVSTVDDREGCIFCDKLAENDDRNNLVLCRGKQCFAMLNLYPYTSGHLMVAPYKHTGSIEDLNSETLAEIMTLSQRCMKAVRGAFNPDGFNLGINIARVAGAGIKDHVHLHVVPRWAGDSNFMPVIGETRVLPRTLDETYTALKELI